LSSDETARAAPAALVTTSRQIHIIDENDRIHGLTSPVGTHVMHGSWQFEQSVATYSWPTWSPDGTQIACFKLPDGKGSTARVVISEVNGINASEVADLDSRLPIYLHWSPDGEHVAILSQQIGDGGDRLALSVATPRLVGHERRLAEGTPLFFTWAGSSRVAAFVGTGRITSAKLALFDPRGKRATLVLPGTPGNFCAPVAIGEDVMYVVYTPTEQTGRTVAGQTTIVVGSSDSPKLTELESVNVLVAFVPSPDGRTVARAVAPDGDGTPYRHLALLDAHTGEVRALSDIPCLAFMWAPTGDSLVVARVDTQRNLLEWLRMDLDGWTQPIVEMYPSRDLGFYLRFFEQYTQSHPLIDPTGTKLLLAGGLKGQKESGRGSHVWEVPIFGGGPVDLGPGVFAVYGPPSRR
jgi:hypothetical protein